MSEVSKQLDYSKHECVKPHYRMTKLTPREGAGNTTVTVSGGQQTHFDIPEHAWNPAKSVLSFTFNPAAGGAANTSHFVPMDSLALIRQIQLYTRSGTMLVDLDHVGTYTKTKVVWKPETELEKFLAWKITMMGLVLARFFRSVMLTTGSKYLVTME